MDYGSWNRGLMLAALLTVTGGMALVSARTRRERRIAVGIVAQAVLLMFVANGAFYARRELPLVAVALLVVLALWWLLGTDVRHDAASTDQTLTSGVDASGTDAASTIAANPPEEP